MEIARQRNVAYNAQEKPEIVAQRIQGALKNKELFFLSNGEYA